MVVIELILVFWVSLYQTDVKGKYNYVIINCNMLFYSRKFCSPLQDAIGDNDMKHIEIFGTHTGYFRIIYNKPTRCNSGSTVFINNYKYALHVSDALCVHYQEHYKL